MDKNRGNPSPWLLKNSKGFPDFLFTILTYSMILLIFLTLIWITFAILAFVHAGSPKASIILQIMDSLKTGLISLAGVIFGLAGSYTVRRFKTDEHYLKKKRLDFELEQAQNGDQSDLHVVEDEEDI